MLVVVLDGGAVVESSFCRWTQAFSTRYLVAVFGRALYLFVVGELSSFVACGVPCHAGCFLVKIIRSFGVLIVRKNGSAWYGFGPERLMRVFVYVVLYLEKISVCA